MLRCPLCSGFRVDLVFGSQHRCRMCWLGFPDNPASLDLSAFAVSPGRYRFSNWRNWLVRSTGHFFDPSAYQFAPMTVRMFAELETLRTSSLKTSLFGFSTAPQWARYIEAELGPDGVSPVPQLTLGVIASRSAWADVTALCQHMAKHVREVVVVVDSDTTEPQLESELSRALPIPARVLNHALAGNFAAQRNRVQEAASTPWVLQLDADERLTSRALQRIPFLIHEAARHGWSVIGLPRRNIVDGIVSALYPDVQYRLLQKSVRFRREVHEYPDTPGLSHFVALGSDILHLISGDRLDQRQRKYESIAPGAGRPSDTRLLRLPLDSTT